MGLSCDKNSKASLYPGKEGPNWDRLPWMVYRDSLALWKVHCRLEIPINLSIHKPYWARGSYSGFDPGLVGEI